MGLLIFSAKGYESYAALLLEAAVHGEMDDVFSVKDERKFEVHCNADAAGELHVGTESLSVKIGQRVQRDGSEEIWHSVLIHCAEADDGSLIVKVIVCHFDWEQSRQIALIQSKPDHQEGTAKLTFDLEHKDV